MTRTTPFALALVALLVAACSTASAFPTLYGSHTTRGQVGDGCLVPDQGYHAHPGPVADMETSVVLMDSTGAEVTAYEPGQVYSGTVSYPSSRSIVLAHKGAISSAKALETTNNATACSFEGRRVTFNTRTLSADFTWTAPEQDEGAVLMQVVRATGASSDYFITELTIASPTDAGPGVVAVGDQAAQMPASDMHDMHDEEEEDDDHDDHAHGDDEDEHADEEEKPSAAGPSDNDSSGASGSASTAAKTLLAALLVTMFAIMHQYN